MLKYSLLITASHPVIRQSTAYLGYITHIKVNQAAIWVKVVI